MDCEHALELISARIDGEITDAESAELDAHLAQCAACRAEAESLRAARDFMAAHGRVTSPPDLSTAIRRVMEDNELVEKRPALASIVPLPTRLRHPEEPAHTPADTAAAREPRARGPIRSHKALGLAAGFMVCALVAFMAYFVVNLQKANIQRKKAENQITTAANFKEKAKIPGQALKSDRAENEAEQLTLSENSPEADEDMALDMELDDARPDAAEERAAKITADKNLSEASGGGLGDALAMAPAEHPAAAPGRDAAAARSRSFDGYSAFTQPPAPDSHHLKTTGVISKPYGSAHRKPLELILKTQSLNPANLQQIAMQNIKARGGSAEIKNGRLIMNMAPADTLEVLNSIKAQAGGGANVTVPEKLLNHEAKGDQQRMIQTEIVFEEQAPAPAEAKPATPAADSE